MVGHTVVGTGKQIWATVISHHLQCCCLGIAHIFGKLAVISTRNSRTELAFLISGRSNILFGVFCVYTFASLNLELLLVFPGNRKYCGPNDEGRENGKWSHLTGGGMIVSPASSPNPNHSGLWSVWLTTAGHVIN